MRTSQNKIVKSIPQVRIQYAWLLANATSESMNEKWGDGAPLETFEYYKDIADKYAGWWGSQDGDILEDLCKILNLRFRQNIIDVHVAPWFYAFSVPMVIGVTFKTKDRFINVLTHEIIHRLLTDNTTYEYNHDFVALWRGMFGDELSQNALIHVPVHAVMKKLYVDIMDRPGLVDLDRKSVAKNASYVEAWEYVDRHGYDEVVKKLRQDIDGRSEQS